jgi:phage baseplate assembly protein W
MHLAFPVRVDMAGRTAATTSDLHIRDMIEQVLFTAPGERVNRPEFGAGLQQLIFAAASDETLAATQFLVHGSLQKWLGELIEVEAVDVTVEDSTLSVVVQYTILRSDRRVQAEFTAS